jgi:uncharacterized membrane protein
VSVFTRYTETIARGASCERLILFSDAVFAIAMTLLVIELHAPEASAAEFERAMAGLLRPYLTFALSFAVIGLVWLSHHRKFRVIGHTDPVLLRLNLLMLFFVASLPLPTAILGEHGDSVLAVVLYAATICAVGFTLSGMWLYAWHAQLIESAVDVAVFRYVLLQSFPVPGIFVLSIPIALLWGPDVAEITWVGAVPVTWLITATYRRTAHLTDQESA